MTTKYGVLFSGGLDSSILVAQLCARSHRVQPLYVRAGHCWERAELAAAQQFLAAIASPHLTDLVELEMPVDDLYGEHWSMTQIATPDDSSRDEEVFLPGRNLLLTVKAALWCQLNGIPRLALAPLVSSPFADATDEFFHKLTDVLSQIGLGPLQIERPFARMTKAEVMAVGGQWPLCRTFSCVAPRGGVHCGRCNKCGERKLAFDGANLVDSTRYATERTVQSNTLIDH
ncbi:MAG: 7-cyano-7-deazaguanine synthase [Pirellulaceae bacterium]|jgi:7-cyano-7-deazaguanine synthase|nr:7-cyano-7-deazaguanine synthase [Pirellulaceae bacterium]